MIKPTLLSPNTLQLLRVLARWPNGPISCAMLCQKASLTRAIGYEIMTRLERAEWVTGAQHSGRAHRRPGAQRFYALTWEGRIMAEAAVRCFT